MAGLLANGRALCALDHASLHRRRAFYSDARGSCPHDAGLVSLAARLGVFHRPLRDRRCCWFDASPSETRAGYALIVFFIAVFPANARAARSGVTLRGKPATALWVRAPMQFLFIFLAWWVSR